MVLMCLKIIDETASYSYSLFQIFSIGQTSSLMVSASEFMFAPCFLKRLHWPLDKASLKKFSFVETYSADIFLLHFNPFRISILNSTMQCLQPDIILLIICITTLLSQCTKILALFNSILSAHVNIPASKPYSSRNSMLGSFNSIKFSGQNA